MWCVWRCVCLAALLALSDCAGADQRRGAEEGLRSSTGKSNSSRKHHRIQHGQCSYTFILPENDAGACREYKAGTAYNVNALQRDAPQAEDEFSSQKIQQLEHVMENYTQWLQKVSRVLCKHFYSRLGEMRRAAERKEECLNTVEDKVCLKPRSLKSKAVRRIKAQVTDIFCLHLYFLKKNKIVSLKMYYIDSTITVFSNC